MYSYIFRPLRLNTKTPEAQYKCVPRYAVFLSPYTIQYGIRASDLEPLLTLPSPSPREGSDLPGAANFFFLSSRRQVIILRDPSLRRLCCHQSSSSSSVSDRRRSHRPPGALPPPVAIHEQPLTCGSPSAMLGLPRRCRWGGGGEGGRPPLHLGRRHRAPSAAEDARLLVVLGAAPQPSTLA